MRTRSHQYEPVTSTTRNQKIAHLKSIIRGEQSIDTIQRYTSKLMCVTFWGGEVDGEFDFTEILFVSDDIRVFLKKISRLRFEYLINLWLSIPLKRRTWALSDKRYVFGSYVEVSKERKEIMTEPFNFSHFDQNGNPISAFYAMKVTEQVFNSLVITGVDSPYSVLSKLKGMLEKGLITDSEYYECKNNYLIHEKP